MERHDSILGIGRLAMVVMLLGLSASAWALSPPPPQPDDELFPLLYDELGGESWTRSDGWFDPDVHWCDWYGVECGQEYMGYYVFESLDLADNNLVGEISEELADLLFANANPGGRLDLSGNQISGSFHFYPRATDEVDLSGNQLSGELPPLTWPTSVRPNGIGTGALAADQRLDLSRNAFTGNVPEDWSEATIEFLDLSDNQLTGGHQTALDAIEYQFGSGHVYLTGNPFEGELTSDAFSAPLSDRDELGAYGGIDICFTRLTIEDPDVREWLSVHHVASADFEQCLNRERTQVDATLSGSWYNPERSGEGVSLMMLENGAPLLYSFSFDLDGQQQWAFEVGHAGERFVEWDELKETQGTFNDGIRREEDYTFIRPVARARFDRVGRDRLNIYRRYTDWRGCGPWEERNEGGPILCPIPPLSDRMDYQRLTELAGTTCENQTETQSFSGAWYNPERSGEGLVVEVLPSGRAVIYWFTYQPDDSNRQAWMIAEGRIEPYFSVLPVAPPYSAVLEAPVIQPIGGVYGPELNPQTIELVDWGQVLITFYPDGRAGLEWESNDLSYGTGGYRLERLAKPMLVDCD